MSGHTETLGKIDDDGRADVIATDGRIEVRVSIPPAHLTSGRDPLFEAESMARAALFAVLDYNKVAST